jgi:hypothetical protein
MYFHNISYKSFIQDYTLIFRFVQIVSLSFDVYPSVCLFISLMECAYLGLMVILL